MQARIALITILTDDVAALKQFYGDALGFAIENDSGQYVEFVSEGVRFAVCARSVMAEATGDASFGAATTGHAFELAFPCEGPAEVDAAYARLLEQGATGVKAPADMPWGQRTAFFADPDGNVHEIFAELPAE